MSFIIDFVGLNHFQEQNGSRLVLLPNGRKFAGMTPHQANFYIEKARLIGRPDQQEWWPLPPLNPTLEAYSLAQFPIKEPVTLEITGLAAPSNGSSPPIESVRMEQLDHLQDLDSKLIVDPPNAKTIAQLTIGQGRFEAFALRSRAPVTRLTSNHTGQIQISARTKGGKIYTLTLRDEAEIVLANTPALFTDEPVTRKEKRMRKGMHARTGKNTQTGMHMQPGMQMQTRMHAQIGMHAMNMSHYVIYEQLAAKPVASRMNPPPPNRVLTLPALPSSQAFFVLLDGQTPSSDCGPTCCGKTA